MVPTKTLRWLTPLWGLSLTALVQTTFAGDVVLAWDPNPEPNIAGYRLYYGPASQVYTNHVSVYGETEATVEGLTPQWTYYFTVTAFDTYGRESGPSEEIQYTIPNDTATEVDPPPVDPPPVDPPPVDPPPVVDPQVDTTPAPRLRLNRVNGRFQFSVVGEPGLFVEVQSSEDLVHWMSLGVFELSGTIRAIRVPEGPSQQFFRAVVR